MNGVTASGCSKGSDRLFIGFTESENDLVEWYETSGIFVPGLSESLLCSVGFALQNGVYTTVNVQPYIMTRSGKCVPLEVDNNATRCRRVKF